HHQRPGRLVVAQRVEQVRVEDRRLLLLARLHQGVVKQVAGRPLLPLLRGDHVLDQLDQDGASVAALEAELAAQVAELALLAAAEAERAAAEAQVGLVVAAGDAQPAGELAAAADADAAATDPHAAADAAAQADAAAG